MCSYNDGVVRRASLLFVVTVAVLCSSGGNAALQSVIPVDANAAPGSSLEYYLCGQGSGELTTGATLSLSRGTHVLGKGDFCLLQNLENVTLQGPKDASAAIYCDSAGEARRGIAFINITNLRIANLKITNCGRVIPDGLPGRINETYAYLGPQQKAVLIFSHCTDVTLESVEIDKYFGYGILGVTLVGDTLLLNVSLLNSNHQTLADCTDQTNRPDLLCAGCGAVFVYDDTNHPNLQDETTSSLHIIDSSFINNSNWLPTVRLFEVLTVLGLGFTTQPILLTGSTGVAVYLGQMGYFVDVKIINSLAALNSGNIGSILLLHYNSIRRSRILLDGLTVRDSNVTTLVDQTNRGGGVLILNTIFFDALSIFPPKPNDVFDVVEITRSHFVRNSAYYGGGIFFYINTQNVSDFRVIIRQSSFVDNVGRFGSALNFFRFQSTVANSAAYIYMEDVVASGNSFPNADLLSNSPENSAVFLISDSDNVTVVGTKGVGSFFHDNDVSVFGTISTNVVFHGHISFEGNRGFAGGALSLVDSSVLYIYNNSVVNFVRNSAFTLGGAIYTNTLGSIISETCAIQYFGDQQVNLDINDINMLNISLVFSNNSARVAGNSVYGSPLYDCFFVPTSALDQETFFTMQRGLIYGSIFQFRHSVGNKLAEFNSLPHEICICQNLSFVGGNCDNTVYHEFDREIIPGETFILFLNSIDVAGTPVASLLYAEITTKSSARVELDPNQYIRSLPGQSECGAVEFTIYAPENTEVHLKLFATVGGQKAVVILNTTSCPPGFTLGTTDGRLGCVCSEFVEDVLDSTCNLTRYTVARPVNYWLGTETKNGSQLVQFASTCPIDYCREDVTELDLRIPDQICESRRTGTLCGACKEGLSTIFGPADCRDCSDVWLLTLLLYALAGVAILIPTFVFDITITLGAVNGAIFYANIVRVNSNIFFAGGGRGFLFWFVSWINLEVGFPICFYDGLNELTKLGLQYVFPIYLLLIIIMIVALSQHSLVMQRLVSQLDGTHTLVSVFYISFLKLLRTVIDTGTSVSIATEGSSREEVVWFFDGSHTLSDPAAIVLIVIGAVVLAVFIIPYVLVITCSTYVQRRVNSTRLNAYFDASLAPFKDKMRFWFGARLILTCILYAIIADRGTNNPTLTLTLQLSFLVGFTILQAFIQPFKRIGIAILDMSFMVNLIMLTVGTTYTIQSKSRRDDQEILVNTSIGIAFVTWLGILLYHIARRMYRRETVKLKVDQLVEKVMDLRTRWALKLKKSKQVEELHNNEVKNGASCSSPQGVRYLNRPSDQHSTPTSAHISLNDMIPAPDDADTVTKAMQRQSFSQLREPVLEFLNVPEIVNDRHTA